MRSCAGGHRRRPGRQQVLAEVGVCPARIREPREVTGRRPRFPGRRIDPHLSDTMSAGEMASPAPGRRRADLGARRTAAAVRVALRVGHA